MKNNFAVVKLGTITKCLDHKRIPLNQSERKMMHGDIPYYGANGVLDYVNDCIFNEQLLLLAEDGGSWGPKELSSYIINGKSWVNNHAHVLRCKKIVNIYYLMNYLNYIDLRKFVTGTTRGKINQSRMSDIDVLLPPLQDQDKIATILETCESAIQKRKEANRLTDEFLKSTFLEMFGDLSAFKHTSIKEITNFIDYRGKTPGKSNNGTKLITAKNVKKGYIVSEPMEFIPSEKYDTWMTRGIPKEGDVLFTTEAPLGNVAKLNISEKVAFAQRILIIQCNPQKLCSDFLVYCLLSAYMQSEIQRYSTGSTARGIRSKEFSKILVPVPPIGLQQKFASLVQKIEKLKEKQTESEKQLSNLFNSLMQKAFRGEL